MVMTRKRITLIVVWALSLMVVAAIVHAQTPAPRGTTPTIISGSDLGFRVERQRGDRVFGTFVVRINGEWIVAEPATGLKPLSGK
jgi:hypothetical protein